MTHRSLRQTGALLLAAVGMMSLAANPTGAQTRTGVKTGPGKLAGVVLDASGTPQMGASVELLAEASANSTGRDFLTNTQGVFRGEKLSPGLYTVRVTLAGFLPTLEKHIRIVPNVTTVVRVELESMFASLDQLRRQPVNIPVEGDDWKWVLRSASATRPCWSGWATGIVSVDASMDRGRPRMPRARWNLRMERGTRVQVRTWCRRRLRPLPMINGWAGRAG